MSDDELDSCLRWLSEFHATFLDEPGEGLWEVGTYWHLGTRPDELAQMDDRALQRAAAEIDRRLSDARHLTLVHGDAKVANFCFASAGGARARKDVSGAGNASPVAAVDFQYIGRGVGVKDVAYFLSSVLSERECEAQAEGWLDVYFRHLGAALKKRGITSSAAVEAEWRALYPLAWADFVRFLNGWAPEHSKIHGYSRRVTDEVLAGLA